MVFNFTSAQESNRKKQPMQSGIFVLNFNWVLSVAAGVSEVLTHFQLRPRCHSRGTFVRCRLVPNGFFWHVSADRVWVLETTSGLSKGNWKLRIARCFDNCLIAPVKKRSMFPFSCCYVRTLNGQWNGETVAPSGTHSGSIKSKAVTVGAAFLLIVCICGLASSLHVSSPTTLFLSYPGGFCQA